MILVELHTEHMMFNFLLTTEGMHTVYSIMYALKLIYLRHDCIVRLQSVMCALCHQFVICQDIIQCSNENMNLSHARYAFSVNLCLFFTCLFSLLILCMSHHHRHLFVFFFKYSANMKPGYFQHVVDKKIFFMGILGHIAITTTTDHSLFAVHSFVTIQSIQPIVVRRFSIRL